MRRTAAEALGQIGDGRAAEALIAAWGYGNSQVRGRLTEALEQIGEPAVKPLIAALVDENGNVRGWAAEALRQKVDDRAVEALIGVMEHSRVRGTAAGALGHISDDWDVEPLIVARGDEDEEMRRAATAALEQIGEPAVEPLIAALGDKAWGV